MNEILCGDALEVLKGMPDNYVDCCITSPPYWGLRDYGVEGQLGLEKTPEEYVAKIVEIFREVRRVLKEEGTLWLNLGDSYAANRTYQVVDNKHVDVGNNHGSTVPDGLKPKDLVGIPWMVAFALRADWWFLRQDIIWAKPNPMPESVTDRCTKSHEYVFLLTKSRWYYYDNEAIKEPIGDSMREVYQWATRTNPEAHLYKQNKSVASNGKTVSPNAMWHDIDKLNKIIATGRNKRSVWTVNTHGYKEAHFATFPPKLIEPMILAGCPENGIVLDPFFGSGTTGLVARNLGRNWIGIELNPDYIEIANTRLAQIGLHEALA